MFQSVHKKAGVRGCLVQWVSSLPVGQHWQQQASLRIEFLLVGGDAELKVVSGLGKAEEADCVPKEAGCNLEVADCSWPAEEFVLAASWFSTTWKVKNIQ